MIHLTLFIEYFTWYQIQFFNCHLDLKKDDFLNILFTHEKRTDYLHLNIIQVYFKMYLFIPSTVRIKLSEKVKKVVPMLFLFSSSSLDYNKRIYFFFSTPIVLLPLFYIVFTTNIVRHGSFVFQHSTFNFQCFYFLVHRQCFYTKLLSKL